MKHLLTAILAAIALVACNSSGCLDNGTALPMAGFYSSATGGAIAIDSVGISGVGAPNDSVLLAPQRSTSQVYLPMRPDAPSVSWVFSYDQSDLRPYHLADTITLTYRTIPYFASAECGAMYIYRVERLDYTQTFIDSVKLVDSLFTNVELERIRIYIRTAAEEEASL